VNNDTATNTTYRHINEDHWQSQDAALAPE